MTAIFTKRIFVALLLAIFSVGFSFASDDETTEKDGSYIRYCGTCTIIPGSAESQAAKCVVK